MIFCLFVFLLADNLLLKSYIDANELRSDDDFIITVLHKRYDEKADKNLLDSSASVPFSC